MSEKYMYKSIYRVESFFRVFFSSTHKPKFVSWVNVVGCNKKRSTTQNGTFSVEPTAVSD